MNIDFSKLHLPDDYEGDYEEDTRLVHALFEEARNFVSSFAWCRGIRESYIGIGVGSVFCVALFRIYPAEGVDEYLWVVVGDLPPAYLVIDVSPTPASALEGYIDEMRLWIAAVREGSPVDKVIPVNAPPTREYADMLEWRLDFLKREILSAYQDELGENTPIPPPTEE